MLTQHQCIFIYFQENGQKDRKITIRVGTYRRDAPKIILMITITFQIEYGFLYLPLSDKMRKPDELLEVILLNT